MFSWARELIGAFSANTTRRAHAARARGFRPDVEGLEHRCVPASFTFQPANGVWGSADNWKDQNGDPGIPVVGDDVNIPLGRTCSVQDANAASSVVLGGTLKMETQPAFPPRLSHDCLVERERFDCQRRWHAKCGHGPRLYQWDGLF